MKNRPYILLIPIILFSACEKAIDLKLPDNSPKYVVTGILANEAGSCRVTISQTKPFTADNSFSGIAGATVSITGDGSTQTLAATGAGVYEAAALTGLPGHTYVLNVTIAGKTFTASSIMPKPVLLDSVYVQQEAGSNKDGSPLKYAFARYRDPAAEKNEYRFIQYVNGKKEKTVFIANDEFTNGNTVNNRLSFSNDNDDLARNLKTGDQLTVEMFCLDPVVYQYWYSLKNTAGGDGNNAAPSNPAPIYQAGRWAILVPIPSSAERSLFLNSFDPETIKFVACTLKRNSCFFLLYCHYLPTHSDHWK